MTDAESSGPGESAGPTPRTGRPAPGGEPPPRRLVRSRDDRVIAGVCGGLGDYFGADPILFRIAFVVLVVAGAGSGIILYLLAWLILPEGDAGGAPGGRSVGGALLGGILVAVGLFWLADTLFPWVGKIVGPAVLVLLGAALWWGGGRRDR